MGIQRVELKPLQTLEYLNKKIEKGEILTLKEFLDFCYHVACELEASKYNQIDQSTIQKINNHPVNSEKKPCLIYEHLSETFCSIVEAYYEKDKEFMEKEVKEVKESIQHFWINSNLAQEKNYQSWNSYFLEGPVEMKMQKQILIKTVLKMKSQYKNVSIITRNNYGMSGKNINKITLQLKQQELKKRKFERTQPLMKCIMSKYGNINPIESSERRKQLQQNWYIIRYMIGQCRTQLK